MSETIEKIYCCDGGGRNNDALLASIMANKHHDDNPMAMAAMMGGGAFGANQWMNNPFAYMMMMAMMRMFGWGNNGYGEGVYGMNGQNAQNIEVQNQLQAIRTQLNDNQNASLLRDAIGDGFNRNDFALSQLSQNLNIDFNTLQKCCCEVQAAIQGVAGQVGFSAERVINAANMGDCNIIAALKDCCCQNKELVQRMGYETQLGLKDVQYTTQGGFKDLQFGTQMGFKDLGFSTRDGFCGLSKEVQFGFDRTNTAIERAASSLGFQGQQDKCDIITAINAAQQRNADLLTAHWSQEQADKIQDLKFENSQLKQNDFFAQQVRNLRNSGCGCNNGCGCGNGCGCNGSGF